MRFSTTFTLTLLLAAGASFAQGMGVPPAQGDTQQPEIKPLIIGDAAPELTVDPWFKGEPVTSFEKGKIYVIEFYGTAMSGGDAAFDHFNKLQSQYKDKNVSVIGIDIAGAETNGLIDARPYFKKHGHEMQYTVGFSSDRPTSRAWLAASNVSSLPFAFIVNADQRVAWAGSPMNGLDQALQEVVAGTYDMDKAIAESKHNAEIQAKSAPLVKKLQEDLQSAEYAEALSLIDQLIALDPQFATLSVQKFRILALGVRDTKKAYDYAQEALTTTLKDDAISLNQLAWMIMTGPNFQTIRNPEVAKKLAERANELSKSEDPNILDTLALACSMTNDDQRAVELETKAVSLSTGAMKEQLQKTLDEYSKNLKKG